MKPFKFASLLLMVACCSAFGQTYDWLGLSFLLTNSVATVKASPGPLIAYQCFNPNASGAFIQVFDAVSGVVLGTTVPPRTIQVVGKTSTGLQYMTPPFSGAIGLQVAATTTAGGSTAPTVPVSCDFFTR